MHRVVPVDHLELPELLPYRTLRRQESHRERGIFVAEGEKVVRRLFRSTWPVSSMLCTPEWLAHLSDAERNAAEAARVGSIPEIFLAARHVISEIVGYRLHQGVMAVGAVPAEESLDRIASRLPRPRLFVALDGIAHAENVGVIMRNSAAFGVGAVIAGETSCSPFLRRAVRNSMGGIFLVPVVHAASLPKELAALRDRFGVRIVAADAHAARPLAPAELRGDLCLVFGGEASGISPEVAALADARLAIPMHLGVDSLNVASASAIFLHEAARAANV
ncbi:MAG: RNA methyltransferase [Planctomycetes bacterium]|nr:RNA methyltransferase [Planctomycetota bacterium]